MNMSFQEILDTQTGDTPNPDVSASISPQDFVNLTPEVQNTILYSIIRDLNTRVRRVEKKMTYYDKLRFIGFGGISVATGVGALIVWALQHVPLTWSK